MHTSGDFVLHGGNTAFANRQKLLFEKLSTAEKECNKAKVSISDAEMEDEVSTEPQPRGQKRKSETKRFRGKESIFKRPEGPAPRSVSRNIPDYRRNPHKWVKYSLDDVSNDDMTERSNTRAALSFLKELKARRSRELVGTDRVGMVIDETEKETKTDADKKDEDRMEVAFKPRTIRKASGIKFKKPVGTEGESSGSVVVDHDENPMFRGSKIIMPEYVVGQKQRRKTKKEKSAGRIERTKQLKLDHLEERDEEEN